MSRTIPILLLALFSPIASAGVETGSINGAEYRIDLPDNWNGTLIVYCHGYSPTPAKFDASRPSNMAPLALAGFAVIQSGYSAGGWAVEEALLDTEALRRHFIAKHGKPKETWVMGHSMGGFLTMAILEKYPSGYDGGLALCGPLASAAWFMERRVFDMRVVFDYYFPEALPNPAKAPAAFAMTAEMNKTIEALLDSKPEQSAAMRRWSGIRSNKELASGLVFFTFILKDLRERGGGNPFDNRDTIYDGTADDNALNDGVARYEADARAVEYLRTYYSPTGRLSRPMLAIHTTYDPLVPPWTPNMYAILARQAGSEALFAQQYVKRPGHCAISPAEMAEGLRQLREWKQSGRRPVQTAR
ncbi:MAG: alpha/beta fold hydrolase [Candidatus Solibacter usitatus]|nr:alpha/beta fold hydrolase [Candidatus Solibacter usitatus]